MPTTWIVSANAGHATIFSQAHANEQLQRVDELDNPPARMRDRDIETDDLGNRGASKTSHNTGMPTTPSGYQPHQTPEQHEAENFARRVAGYLEKAHADGRFDELCLVATPQFLGELRGQLGKNLQRAVKTEIDKDFTHSDARELGERLQAHTRH